MRICEKCWMSSVVYIRTIEEIKWGFTFYFYIECKKDIKFYRITFSFFFSWIGKRNHNSIIYYIWYIWYMMSLERINSDLLYFPFCYKLFMKILFKNIVKYIWLNIKEHVIFRVMKIKRVWKSWLFCGYTF